MKFNILKVILWLKSGHQRELNFEPEKINLITGWPSTGKSDIINIIYYSLFYDEANISDSIINDNVDWYGIKLEINDKIYTICRGRIKNHNPSEDFFFSSTGDVPKIPKINISKKALKSIIETEFSISKDTNIPFGGKYIRKDSKISMDFLLMMNLIDVSIIENRDVYVAFQNDSRYKEALERIFDLVLGIESVENIITREKYQSISSQISQLEKKQEILNQKTELFHDELQDIANKVKAYGLIENNLQLHEAIKQIELLLKNLDSNKIYTEKSERDVLQSQLTLIQYKLKNLINFQESYQKYQNTNKKNLESLSPIEYLLEKDRELVKTSIYEDLLNTYKDQIYEIKNANSEKSPINSQIRSIQIKLEEDRRRIENLISNLPKENESFTCDKEKIYFLGQIKTKLDLYKNSENGKNYSNKIASLKKQLSEIKIDDTTSKRESARTIAENQMKKYMEVIRQSLDNYKDYIPYFDIKNKRPHFINPTNNAIENIGSSSNHMFMQLLFSLGIQELAFVNKSKFLAPFLIIDQLSRPYYGENNKKQNIDSSDESKIKNAFKLLDYFMTQRLLKKAPFQMIVLEHIPKEYVENLGNVHIVEEFLNGNALIHRSEYEKNAETSQEPSPNTPTQ